MVLKLMGCCDQEDQCQTDLKKLQDEIKQQVGFQYVALAQGH